MKKTIYSIILGLFFFTLSAQEGITFKYKQKKGESYSHTSTIEEEAYYNGLLNNRTQIVNRTSTTVKEVLEDGSALLYTHYMTTENYLLALSGRNLTWGEESEVTLKRTVLGKMYDSDNQDLPTVQGVPSFLDKPIKIGESWTAPGKEVHDLRKLFSMNTPLEIPFTATYTYKGDEEVNGVILNIIECNYTLSDKGRKTIENPRSIYYGTTGYAKQKIYWDNKKGEIDHYTEEFQINLKDVYNNSYIFCSVAHGEVIEYKSVNDDETLKEIQNTVKEYNLENINVKKGDKGLTISLENIQFEPDSNVLLPPEQEKLKKIGEILKNYSNDLLITGHCALRGNARSRQILSEERAESVADYLKELKIRDEYHIYTAGKGAEEPVASNDTEEGRAKNRRVEITIMD